MARFFAAAMLGAPPSGGPEHPGTAVDLAVAGVGTSRATETRRSPARTAGKRLSYAMDGAAPTGDPKQDGWTHPGNGRISAAG